MDNILSSYLAVQRTIESNPEVASILENLFEDSSRAVVMIEDITKIFPHENYLIRCWSNINEKIQTATNVLHLDCNEINNKYFYGCLYASIMKEDESNPQESPVLITLTTLLRVGILRSNEEFLKEECSKVFMAGLKRIHTRDLMQWDITSEFLYDCLKGIKTMVMSSLLINSFIHMLMMYAGKHFNMVNNLALADGNSPVGVLAFACLANLLVKDCDDKQVIIETMLENIEHVMDNNNSLNSFQVSVKQSNFRQMIRQVGNALTGSTDQLFFGIVRVAERYPKSKTLVFIINQLPFSVFGQLTNVIVNLCYRSYYQQMQMFCFNMLESPYLTEEQEEQDALEHVYQNIAVSIVWPMNNIEQLQPVVETIKLIYSMLQIQNTLVRNVVLKITQTNPIMKDLMTYLNQYCDKSWKQEYKVMNQYYVSVYCRLLILNKETWRDKQFVQFTSLLLFANPHDLLPCLKDITALISSNSFTQKEVQSVILNCLVIIANQTASPQSKEFLKLLHNVIFGDLRNGNGYYNLIVLKTSRSDLLLKNMVKNKLITQRDVESLSILCKHLRGWRLMSDLAIHMDFPLPRNILNFTEHLHEMKLNILKDTSIMYITRFFSEVVDRKAKCCQSYEKECLQRFAVFLEGNLINRSVPIHTLPIALITMRKYYNYYKSPLPRLISMANEVESLTCKAFKEVILTHGNFGTIAVFPRDITYFAEMQLVFGDLKEFTCKEETTLVIENVILYFPNIRKEFTHLSIAMAMIQCMTKISIRNEDMLNATVNSLCSLLKLNQPKIKEVCIDCLYDIALFRTSSFDVLIPHIYDLLTTNNSENAVTALNIYSKLFSKEHAIPNDWQTFTIALAISNKQVIQLLEPLTFDNFMKNLHPYFETYFIHIMFYSNEICDDEDHFLLPEFRKKIITHKLSSERRRSMYKIIIKYFTAECRTKILTYIYKKLADQYLKEKNLNNNSMTKDILVVTYLALKNQHLDYPELSKFHYERTVNQIKNFENYSAKKMGNGINVNEIIVLIVGRLVHLLNNLNEIGHIQLMLKLYHLLFAIIDWNYSSIFNAIVDEGMNGNLRKSILKLLDIFNSHNHIFQYNDTTSDNEFQERPIQSICGRI